MARVLPGFVRPRGEAGGEVEGFGRQAARQSESFHAEPTGAGEGGGVERSAAHGAGTERSNVTQEWHRVDHFEVERHGAHSPFQALEHLRKGLVPAAHSHGVEAGFAGEGVAHQAQSECGVGAVDDAFGEGQAVVGGRRGVAANGEDLATEDVASAHRALFEGQKKFEGGHPARVGGFGKLLVVRSETGGGQPAIELADGGNGVLLVGQDM